MKIKKKIPEGSIIHKEKPFVCTLNSKYRTERCDFCFKKGQLMKCSNCRYVYYCGKVCQKDGWYVHKFECKNLKQIAPKIMPNAARTLVKLIRILQKGGDLVKTYYEDNNFRMYKDLMSHYPNLKTDPTRMDHFTSLCGVLFEFFNGHNIPNSAELMGMYGRMCINSFNIMDQEMQCLGTGIYLGASVIDHSCAPNAAVIFEGTTLLIRALRTFQYLDWSEIFIAYIDILNTKKDRQDELKSTYYFLCQCQKCISPESPESMAAACPNPNCDNFINSYYVIPGDKCSKCGTIVTEEFLDKFKEVTEFTDMHLKNMEQLAYYDVCTICLEKQKGVLYKFNVKHVKTLDLAFQSSIDIQKWKTALIFGLELIDAYYKFYGKLYPLTGLLHLKLGKLLLYEGNNVLALDHLEKAVEILKVTHGRNSSLFKEELVPLLMQARNETVQ